MQWLWHIVAIVLVGIGASWLGASPIPDAEAQHARVVQWQTLRELDYQTGEKSPAITELVGDGVTVRVPGFMVPLEDVADAVTEFFLTPYVMACVHVPPPPPNQMIYVKMAGSKKQKVIWEPVWVQGRLQVVETASPYGEAAYTMTGELVERY